MKFLILVTVLFVTACSSEPPQAPQTNNSVDNENPEIQVIGPGPLDGVWVYSDIKCEKGSLTTIGKRERARIRHGEINGIIVIDRNVVEVIKNNYSSDKKKFPTAHCEIRVKEYWDIVPAKSQITISNSIGTLTSVTRASEGCDGDFNYKDSRTHGYKLQGNTLSMILTQTYSPSSAKIEAPDECKGALVWVYKRLF